MAPLIQDNLEQIQLLCQKHRVLRLFLIGSATGPNFNKAESDVDFVVVFEPQERKGFDDVYFHLLEDLSNLLGRPVDLIEPHTLKNPYFIASINRTKRMLYAA